MGTVARVGSRGVIPWLVVCLAAGPHSVQARRGAADALSAIPLPGGLSGAREASGDRASPSAALFLAEAVRRFNHAPGRPGDQQAALDTLLTRLARFADPVAGPTAADASDMLPLPLTETWWNETVFHGQSSRETLVADILRSHGPSLLYWALLALDPPTRSWLAGRRALIDRLMHGELAAFVAVAPAFRVRSGLVVLPGGDRAAPGWESLTGASASDGDAFLPGLLKDDGRLAAFFHSVSKLSDDRLRAVLQLDADDPRARVDAMRRLYETFSRVNRDWTAADHPFTLPPRDPVLLLTALRVEDGRLLGSGPRELWQATFERRVGPNRRHTGHAGEAGPVDLPWLLDQVYVTDPRESQVRVDQVLFESHVLEPFDLAAFDDDVATLVALGRYPAIVRTLERLHVTDPSVYRRAADRAAALSAISDRSRRRASIAQFQGTLALIARAAVRGSLAGHDVPGLVSSLSAVNAGDQGYEGRLARWIHEHLGARVPLVASTTESPMQRGLAVGIEAGLLRLLAGPSARPRQVTWEGTTYRVDLTAAESRRLDRVRGDAPTPFLDSAWALLAIADRLSADSVEPDTWSRESRQLQRVARESGWEIRDGRWPPDTVDRYHALARDFGEASRSGRPVPSSKAVRTLRLLADDFLARGLAALAYAAALGERDASPITSEEAAERHDFGIDRDAGSDVPVAWRLPAESARTDQPWHIEGSLLDLDVCLAGRWLRRVSWKPPAAPPSLDPADRQVLSSVVVTEEHAALTDAARDRVALALQAGRARLEAATEEDIGTLGDVAGLDPVRRSLLSWGFEHDRRRLSSLFSTSELFWLGAGEVDRATLDAFGAASGPRSGCLCVRLPDRSARQQVAGHPEGGLLMSVFPDLGLRMAELLAELAMPAALMPYVLESATWDLVQQSPVRFPGDLRGLADHVRTLSLDQAERYLALLTTEGPLVPVDVAGDTADQSQR